MDFNNTIIEFNNVTITDTNQTIINSLSFNITQGENISISGHNDKDRTLLLYAILGVIFPDGGNISILGHNLSSLSEQQILKLRHNIGYAAPRGGLLRNISIKENIRLPIQFNFSLSAVEVDERYDKILSLFDIRQHENDMSWKLDPELEKKVMLARAIIHNPKILLLDEPTTYIEQYQKGNIIRLIESIRSDKLIDDDSVIILTTEDNDWDKYIADYRKIKII